MRTAVAPLPTNGQRHARAIASSADSALAKKLLGQFEAAEGSALTASSWNCSCLRTSWCTAVSCTKLLPVGVAASDTAVEEGVGATGAAAAGVAAAPTPRLTRGEAPDISARNVAS